jgi:hypothetical protein
VLILHHIATTDHQSPATNHQSTIGGWWLVIGGWEGKAGKKEELLKTSSFL